MIKKSNIHGYDLCLELKVLRVVLEIDFDSPLKILSFISKIDSFTTCFIIYRILLTIHVTVASAERTFSKLKLIKNYLRSTMSQERLNGLTILSIENELLKILNTKN